MFWRTRYLDGATTAEGRRLLRLFGMAFFVGAILLFGLDFLLRSNEVPIVEPRSGPQSSPTVTVVPWDPDVAWYERLAMDGVAGDEPESGLRLLERLRERAVSNFVLDPRFSAFGGFQRVTSAQLLANPKTYRTEPVALSGVLASVDRRRFDSLFGECPNLPLEEVWLGRVSGLEGEVRFILWDSRDLTHLKGRSVRVLGVFHRTGAPRQTVGVLPMIYAKRVVESPEVVRPSWPLTSEVERLRLSDPTTPLDTVDLRSALVASIKGAPRGEPRRIQSLGAQADLAPWIGQGVRIEGRVLWTSEEPFLATSGEPYEFPDPSDRDVYWFRVALIVMSDGGFVTLCETASAAPRVVGTEISITAVPIRAFHYRNRGSENVGIRGGQGYDPNQHGVTRTLLVVGCALPPP